MIYVDFIFGWLLPLVASCFLVMMGVFAIWQSCDGTVEKNTRIALLVGGAAVILHCGGTLNELRNYEPNKQQPINWVRI